MEFGDIVLINADDPAAAIDIPHFCNESGHTLISKEPGEDGSIRYKVKK